MSFIVEAFFSGCISKVVNDGTDFSILLFGKLNDAFSVTLNVAILC